MNIKKFERKKKDDKPVLAICYDFDKTLTPDDMQAQGFIQEVGYDVDAFWKESNALAENNDMDGNLAYMFKMVENAEGTMVFSRKTLAEYGAKVRLFKGVTKWFERIRQFGAENGVTVEHYIISSGLKEMIEGTVLAKSGAFEKIYASSFYYNEKGVAKWPAQVVNYTNKTQFLFRIEKGVLDINDPAVNDFFPPDEIRVPFRNIVYIGDSDTDIPCMKLVTSNGGNSIAVFDPQTNDRTKAHKMIRDGRVKYFVPADYSEGTELDRLIKTIILHTAEHERLQAMHYRYLAQTRSQTDSEQDNLIFSLEESRNFATTHTIIRDLKKYSSWTYIQREHLLRIALENPQVGLILADKDVAEFYERLVAESPQKTDAAKTVEEKLHALLKKD